MQIAAGGIGIGALLVLLFGILIVARTYNPLTTQRVIGYIMIVVAILAILIPGLAIFGR